MQNSNAVTPSPTLIIAEAGVNHNGRLDLAMQLIDAAAHAGADLVKFQTFSAQQLVTNSAAMADYQAANTGSSSTQLEMLRDLELGRKDHEMLIAHCEARGIGFFSTAFDVDSLNLLYSLGAKRFKVPSGEITNFPYLVHVASFGLPVILSTGMSNLGEIEQAIGAMESSGLTRNLITVLHCNTEYPTPMCDVNLRAMRAIREAFGVAIGYSDHTLGIEVPIAAVAMGATVIEKHLTLDRNLPGPDHRASLESTEFTEMVRAIRNIELAMGDGIKCASNSERKNILDARKSLVAVAPIRAGELFSERNIGTKRPGNGLSPMRWNEVVGQAARRDFAVDELIAL
jgi:N,N'-diacetyllegionaminate synthase